MLSSIVKTMTKPSIWNFGVGQNLNCRPARRIACSGIPYWQ